jgi:drug/metabolite transporter (DMT)-like permease
MFTLVTDFFGNYRGELAALGCAAIWSVATIYFLKLGKEFSSSYLNFYKCLIALILLLVTGILRDGHIPAVAGKALLLLSLSGLVGIGIGDTAYFECLRFLGARRSLLMGILAPPLTGVIAFFFIGEALPPVAWLGILLTISGVAWVVSERTADGPKVPGHLSAGVFSGIFYSVCQAVGSVLTREALLETDVDLLWSVIIRLAAGVIFLLFWVTVRRSPSSRGIWPRKSVKTWSILLWATFIGTYLALIMQQVALKFASAGIAQTLLMTSHLFYLPISWKLGEKLSTRAILGALVGTGGIVLLFLVK